MAYEKPDESHVEPESDRPSFLGDGGLVETFRNPKFWIGIAVVVVLIALIALGGGDSIAGIVYLAGGAALYFLPSIIARKKPNNGSVLVVNLFLGWTLIGWVVALAMAANNPARIETRSAPATEPTRTCPYCAEDIKAAAVVCRHCGRDLP